MLNIANGYESNSSRIIKDRFKEYKKHQEKRILQLKLTQEYMDNSGFPFSPKFEQMIKSPLLRLEYLAGNNRFAYENVTMKTA